MQEKPAVEIIATVVEEDPNVDIPCYFLCPISIQLMKDPVTVTTGITYDRDNIEKWLFTCKHATCPVTNQALPDRNLTPNHMLRRLIQSWCAANGVERIPTPRPPADASQILKILDQARRSPPSELTCLSRLQSIAVRNEASRTHLRAAGAAAFLADVIIGKRNDAVTTSQALSILHRMELPDSDLKKLIAGDNGGELRKSLTHVMEIGNSESRAQAVMLLQSLFHVADPDCLVGSEPGMYEQVTRIITDRVSVQATKAALRLLLEVCPWGKNRVKAVRDGAVWALLELILETGDRRVCELGLGVLDQLCGCAEGRAELLRHGGGVALVSKKVLRVSAAASDRAVKVLWRISRYVVDAKVVEEMAAVGVAAKLCLVVQVEGQRRTVERAAEILRRHARIWRESSCIPPHLLASYPN